MEGNIEKPKVPISEQIAQAGSREELAVALENYSGTMTKELGGNFSKEFSGPDLAKYVRSNQPVTEWTEKNIPDAVLNKLRNLEG